MSDTYPLVLVDGSSYLFRAFHALPPLTTGSGQPTGAIKGVISMIRKLINDNPDSYIAVVFDAKGKTFRNELFDDYKATRPPMPDDLRSQIEPIHRIIRAMGLPCIVVEGVEADDVIGTLAQQAWREGMRTLVSTGDKDMAQLVNDHVTLLNTMTDEVLDEAGVEGKFGLPPECIVDYLALMGDKVDNIPGVPGVGPKTAVKWLQQYRSVDNLIEHADEIKGKIGERLRDNLEQLRLSHELATIKCDVALDFGPRDLVHKDADQQELLSLFRELEFRPWARELEKEMAADGVEVPAGEGPAEQGAGAPQITPDKIDYRTLTELDQVRELTEQARRAGSFALSLETDGGHYKVARLIGLSLCHAPGEAAYIPLAHEYAGVPEQPDSNAVLDILGPLLEDNTVFKAVHELKYANHVLLRHGIALRGARFDPMLQSYVLNSVAHRHSLDKLAGHYLQEDKLLLEELLGKGRGKIEYHEVDLEQATRYAAQNADFCLRLARLLDARLQEAGPLADIYRYFEIALVPALTRMEENGIKVDVDVLARQSEHLATRLEELESTACELAGEVFNLGSPKQLQEIFYQKLNYPVLKKTAKGQPSTAEPILQELALEYELPRVIVEHRGLSKLKSTYTDKLPLQLNPQTHRIHSSFQQAVTATGRLSSTDPNLQNIPIRTEEGRRIRQAFVADQGHVLMAADYSQVELRIMAHLSGDLGLLKAFTEGLDVHRATAAEIFNAELEEVSAEQRRSAKAINFGLIYGMSAFGLANQLGIARGDAQAYVERYFERYPGVRKYMDNTRVQASEQGYVETLFGRRLYLPDIKASNGALRRAAERTAINAPMQGTAADIIKQAMVDIHQWLEVAGLDARMVLQVHDELVFEVAEKDLDLLADGVRFRMVSAASLDVPLVVDIGTGANWDEAH